MAGGARITVQSWQDAAGVTLAAGELAATFVPELGMLGVSLHHRGEELLALPGGLAAFRDSHTTGLPLLAPWANRLGARRYSVAGVEVDLDDLDLHLDPPTGLPIHGTLLGAHRWDLAGLDAGPSAARMAARFAYDEPDLLAAFPFAHELSVHVTVEGAVLELATTLRATGERPVPVAFGWHPYLRLPGQRRRSWLLRLPERDHLALDPRALPTGGEHVEPPEVEPVGERTFDDLYRLGGERRAMSIETSGRRVVVSFGDGYPYAQVYAPAGQEYICLEPMTAPTNALATGGCPLVHPGESFTATWSIVVEDA